MNNRFETVNLLLSLAGDDEESLIGFEGQLPIHYAALRGTEDMVKLCCERRPQDIQKLDYSNHSALDIALMEHNIEAQTILRTYYPDDGRFLKQQSLEK